MNIRPYKPEDKPALIAILRLNTPQYFAPQEEKDFIHYLDHETELYYVIELENSIVGCGGINFKENKTVGVISWDMLNPNVQRKSLGSKLLQYRLQKIMSIPGITQTIVRTTQYAYTFYQQHGFKTQYITENYWAAGLHLYYMKLIE